MSANSLCNLRKAPLQIALPESARDGDTSTAMLDLIEKLHYEMGRFLTESSDVENMMLGLVTLCDQNSNYDEVFVRFNGKTFGGKISDFKRACGAHPKIDAQHAAFDEICLGLDGLLPKRNWIVHGTTQCIAKGDLPTQALRIGMTRGDGDFMKRAISSDFTAEHVFTAEKIARVTQEFADVRAKLGALLMVFVES